MPLASVYGDLGSGKTLLLTYIAAHVEENIPILANYTLRLPNYRPLEPEMLYDLKYDRALVLIDEAYTWLESLVTGSKINRYWSYILFQSRKRGLEMFITAQLPRTINIRFKEMSEINVYCMRIREGFKYIVEREKMGEIYYKSYVLPFAKAEKYYPLYDTLQIVRPPNVQELGMEFVLQDQEKLMKLVDKAVKDLADLDYISKDSVETALIEKGYSPKLTKYVYTKLKRRKQPNAKASGN